jgi:putative membrane protein
MAVFGQVAPSGPPPNAPPDRSTPKAGANSFTEAQAKSRLERMGYSEISELRLDDRGIWRGRAMYGTQQVQVSVDYRGAITRE